MTMADPPGWTHLLLESGRLENLQTPLRGSARLKFTCLSVSTRFIALGSNTGNVYIFDRNTQKHLQVVFPEVDPAAVNVVALCPNEKLVAFSTLNGHVIVMEMNVDKRARPERLKLVTEHMRTTVTCIQWEHSGGKIYVADATGKVSMSVVPKVKNLVEMPVDVIMRLESSVIQMDWSDNKLLVSTMTRAYLCNTIRQQYSQIGKKPRDGEYGACFYKLSKTSLPMMYCARPSSRVWEVDYEGNVLSTHQFKHLLATPPIKVIDINEKAWATPPASEWAGQGVNLPRLKMFGSQYLVSWRNSRVYVLNPVKVKVILWTELETDIQELCTMKSDMYLFLTSGEVRRIQMFSVSQVVSILQKKNVMLAADLCYKFQQVLLKGKWRKHLSIERLQNLQQQIKGTDLEQVYNNFMVEVLKKGNIDDSDDEDSSESNRSRSSSSASVQSYSRVLNAVSRPSIEDTIVDCVDTVSDGDSHKEFSASEFPPNDESFGQTYEDHNDARNDCCSDTDNTQAQNVSGEIVIEECSGSHSDEVTVEKNIIKIEDEIGNGILDSSHDFEPGCDLDIDRERNEKTSLDTPHSLLHGDGNHEDNTATICTGDEVDNTLPVKSQGILQNDEDLAPVLAMSPSLEVSSTAGRGKKKKRVKTVNLGVASKGNKTKQKGTKSGGGMKRSLSTSVIEGMANDTDSLTKSLSLDIYEDDIFSEETVHLGASSLQEKTIKNEANLSEANPEKSMSSLGMNMAEGCDPVSITSSKPPNNGTQPKDRNNDGMMKVKSESDIAANLLSAHSTAHRTNGDRSSSVLNGSCDGKTAEYSSSYEGKLAEFMSSTEKKDLTSSLDSSSLGSSPSQSPLSQSWEGLTGGSHTSTSPKVSLISMKDSLQSKFTVTKRRLLKTIKEKTLLTKSPSHEDLSTMNVLPKSLSGEDLSMMDSVPDKTKSGFGSIAESSCEQNGRPELKPPVDLSDLMAKTKSTLKVLEDTAVVLNSNTVMETLRGWVVQLNSTLHVLHTQMYNTHLIRTDSYSSSQVRDKDENNPGTLKDGVGQEEDGKEKITQDPYNTDQWTECWSEGGQTKHQFVDSDTSCVENSDQAEKVIGHVQQSSPCEEVFSVELAQEVSDSIHSNDPFNMPDDLIHNVADLARTCFQAGCYGNVSVYSKPSTTKLDSIIEQSQSDSLRNNKMSIQQTEEDGAFNTPKQQTSLGNSGDQDRIGAVLDDINKQDSPVSEDEDVCSFIQNYCFLLDLCRVKEMLHSYHGNLFQFWCTYIKCLHEFYKKDMFFVKLMNKEVHYAVDILKTGGYSAEKVLSCVTKLFEENSDQALEICQDSIHIQPLDVYFMCQYHSQSVSQYFSPYMYTRVNDVMTTNRQCDSVYSHHLIRLKWLEMLLVENRPADELTGKDNFPRPGSHLADWKKPEFIIHVLNSAADDGEREEFLELVQSSGFWLGYLQLLQQLQRREALLTTVVHLGDINLFGDRYNYVPKTKQEWTFVVKFLHKQYKSQRSSLITGEASCKDEPSCTGDVSNDSYDKVTHPKGSGNVSKQDGEDQDLEIRKNLVGINEPVADTSIGSSENLSNTISWDDFASLMLCHLGPIATVTILQECDLQKGQMSSCFHQSALITMLLDRTKRNVTHNLLEKLDSYLWAKKPTTLMPELRYTVIQEKMAKGAALSTSQRDKDSLIAYMPEAVQPCGRYQEDTECHWGISTKMTRTCMCCNLSLTEAVSHVEPGVLSFQCGHVFHRLCVPEKMCLLCGFPSRQQLTHV